VINSAEGVLYAEMSALADGGSFRTLSISNGNSTSNVVGLLYRTAVNEIWMQVRGSGVETNINLYDVNQNENNKIALLFLRKHKRTASIYNRINRRRTNRVDNNIITNSNQKKYTHINNKGK
jgi:hypothetical protein